MQQTIQGRHISLFFFYCKNLMPKKAILCPINFLHNTYGQWSFESNVKQYIQEQVYQRATPEVAQLTFEYLQHRSESEPRMYCSRARD